MPTPWKTSWTLLLQQNTFCECDPAGGPMDPEFCKFKACGRCALGTGYPRDQRYSTASLNPWPSGMIKMINRNRPSFYPWPLGPWNDQYDQPESTGFCPLKPWNDQYDQKMESTDLITQNALLVGQGIYPNA